MAGIADGNAPPPAVCKEGFLEKQNPQGFMSYRMWKRRLFKLDEFRLQYFERDGDEQPLKVIAMANIKSTHKSPTDKLRFEIATNLFMRDGKATRFLEFETKCSEIGLTPLLARVSALQEGNCMLL